MDRKTMSEPRSFPFPGIQPFPGNRGSFMVANYSATHASAYIHTLGLEKSGVLFHFQPGE